VLGHRSLGRRSGLEPIEQNPHRGAYRLGRRCGAGTEELIAAARGEHLGGRVALDAAEVAGPVVHPGSAANTGITGQVITVTGGS
jgi:hypothetical protein